MERLEKNGKGLKLTWEVRDGMLNHRTSGTPHTLEGQVVRLCDKISYIHHDMDDAQRAGIFQEDDIPITIRVTPVSYTHLRIWMLSCFRSDMEMVAAVQQEILSNLQNVRKIWKAA